MIPSSVTVAGWNGTEHGANGPDHDEKLGRRILEELEAKQPGILARYHAEDRDARRAFVDHWLETMHGYYVAYAHIVAAPIANQYATLRTQALAAVEQAGAEYDDLSRNTTINWLAAHHRFVLTTQRARTLLEQQVAVAEQLRHLLTKDRTCYYLATDSLSREVYFRFVPAEDRITLPDVEEVKTQLADFVQLSTGRFSATRATITGGYPDGFAPPAIDTDMPEPDADDEIAWTSQPYTATPAVVAGERGW